MCYGIHETTMKPDVLSNAFTYSLKFAEVEMGALSLVSVKTLCLLSFLERPLVPFIPRPKITALPLAERGQVVESHQAN